MDEKDKRIAELNRQMAMMRQALAYAALLDARNHCLFTRNGGASVIQDVICKFPPGRLSYVGLLLDTSKVAQAYENGIRCGVLERLKSKYESALAQLPRQGVAQPAFYDGMESAYQSMLDEIESQIAAMSSETAPEGE